MRGLVRYAVAAGLLVAALAGCGGSGSSGSASDASAVLPTIVVAPNIKALLAQPIAMPRVCAAGSNTTSSGRSSPWTHTVDVSVYAKPSDSPRQLRALGRTLRRQPRVLREYFESQTEAYREYQRLYTCSAAIKPHELPASWRLVLTAGTTVGQRNALVAKAQLLPGVDVVACDPSRPCVDVVRSVDPTITAAPSSP